MSCWSYEKHECVTICTSQFGSWNSGFPRKNRRKLPHFYRMTICYALGELVWIRWFIISNLQPLTGDFLGFGRCVAKSFILISLLWKFDVLFGYFWVLDQCYISLLTLEVEIGQGSFEKGWDNTKINETVQEICINEWCDGRSPPEKMVCVKKWAEKNRQEKGHTASKETAIQKQQFLSKEILSPKCLRICIQ
jgi:hypothetical protein